MTQRKSLCAAAVALALVSGSAFATNGYFAHGYGTKNKGLAGSGVALPQDAMTAATNPAGMASVGDRLDIGAAIFTPLRSYTASTPTGGPPAVNADGTEVDSGRNIFLIPHFAYNKMLDDKSSIGVAVYGNGGMNTKYSAKDTPGGAGTFGGGNAGVDLMQLFITPTYSRKVSSNVSLGVSAILAYQRFKALGLSNFGVTDDSYDDSFGMGAKIGILADVSNSLTLGASYQSKIYMSKFDKYKTLYAEQGDFDIPANFTLGLAFKATKDVTFTADVQRILYSDIASISNSFFSPGALGDDNGPGFGWDDMTVYKLGAQWAYSSDLTLRAGFSHTDAPMPSNEVFFNILAPAVVENHFTLGATQKLSKGSELTLAAMYAPSKTVRGNPFGYQDIAIKMSQFELEVSYGMTW